MHEEVKVGDMYEVKIPKQDHFGRGIVKIKNMFVFVDGTLPGDLCRIEVLKVKKSYATARVTELLTESSSRVDVKCPYYEQCGGCHIMHEDYNKQLEFKENKVLELLRKFTNLKDINMYPIVSKNPFNYRNKVMFHGENGKLGFYEENTHLLVPIEECVITNETINKVYREILRCLNDNQQFQIDDLMIRVTSTNEVLVVINGKVDEEKVLTYLDGVSSCYLNDKVIKGNDYIMEAIFDLKFQLFPSSFFQVNYEMMLVMYRIVMNFYKDKSYGKVLDLYCGTGTIGSLIAPYVKEVYGVEVEEASINSANLCKKINKLENIEFVLGKVEDNIDQFKDVDSVIVDPPRNGLDTHTIDTILELKPETIVYISCDPVTLARDLKKILEDYDLVEVHPIDMFPNTYHVESVSLLLKK